MDDLVLKPGQNTGVIFEEPKAGDYVAETVSGLIYAENNPIGDWTAGLPSGEVQKKIFVETMACVSFSAVNVLEVQINWMLKNNKIHPVALTFLQSEGYIINGEVNFSDRFVAKMSGTSNVGNAASVVWDAIKHFGLIPESDWAFGDNFDWNTYYAEIPQSLKEKGKRFLEYFNIGYEWVVTGIETYSDAVVQKHLKQAPLQVLARVCPGWNTDSPVLACGAYPTQHATMIYKLSDYKYIFDHYKPFQKRLAKDYGFPFIHKGLITTKENLMQTYWAQANSALHAFTGKQNNDPDATELATAWVKGDQVTVDRIMQKYTSGDPAAANKLAAIEKVIHG